MASTTAHSGSGGGVLEKISATVKGTVHDITEHLPGHHHKDDKVADVHAANAERVQQQSYGAGPYEPRHTTMTKTASENLGRSAGATTTPVNSPEARATGQMQDLSMKAERGSHNSAEETICDTKTFTKMEDRPVVIERKEYIKEHHPFEKQYRVETKYVGETEVPTDMPPEVVGEEVRTFEETPPSQPCEGECRPATATVTKTVTETETTDHN